MQLTSWSHTASSTQKRWSSIARNESQASRSADLSNEHKDAKSVRTVRSIRSNQHRFVHPMQLDCVACQQDKPYSHAAHTWELGKCALAEIRFRGARRKNNPQRIAAEARGPASAAPGTRETLAPVRRQEVETITPAPERQPEVAEEEVWISGMDRPLFPDEIAEIKATARPMPPGVLPEFPPRQPDDEGDGGEVPAKPLMRPGDVSRESKAKQRVPARRQMERN
eukprot:6455068-Amphidinium_carterae.1